MSKAIAILLSVIVLLPSIQKVAIIVDYEVNKDYIARNLCINRDKPEMACEGKCQLCKRLEESENKAQQPVSPVPSLKEITLFYQPCLPWLLDDAGDAQMALFHFAISFSNPANRSVFHPPEFCC